MHCLRSSYLNTPGRLTITLAMTLLLSIGLIGCGGGEESAGTSTGTSASSQQKDNGFTLRSGETTIEARTSAALLPAYGQGEFNLNLMGGWVNIAAARAAGQQSDEQTQKAQGRRSFGAMQLKVSADSAEPGTYQLGPNLEGERAAVVVIPEEPDRGLNSKYTSQSGTLTLDAAQMESGSGDSGARVIGSFDGTFVDEGGNERSFSGTFRYVDEE